MQIYIASFALAEGGARSVSGFDLSAEESVDIAKPLRATYAKPFHRLNTVTRLSFSVSRVHADAITAQNFLVLHHASMPKTGTVTIVIEDPSGTTQNVYIANCVNLSSRGKIQGACTTVNEYQIVGGLCSGAALGATTTFESREDAIANGAERVAVVFDTEKNTADYHFDELAIVNTTDGDPMRVWTATIIAKATTGFTVLLNGAVDSANYKLRSTVEVIP